MQDFQEQGAIIWRDELNGELHLPTTNLSETVSLQDDVKKLTFDFESFLSEKICDFASNEENSFRKNMVLWWAKKSKLVTFLEFKEDKSSGQKHAVC